MIEIKLTLSLDPELKRTLDRVLSALEKNEEIIMADLTQLTADVAADTSAVNSAVTLLTGLSAQLKAAGTDPTALAALQTTLETNTAALAAAVVANTPAAPAAA